MEELERARKIIDEVDGEMAKLFCRRMEAAKEIAAYKGKRGLPVFAPSRENAVLAAGGARVGDEEMRSYYTLFLKEVMAISRSYQQKLLFGERVAYAGTAGAFAHLAVRRLFPDAEAVAYADFFAAWRAVEEGECDIAVLPIENSFQGEVGAVTDLMFSGSLFLNAVTEMPVTQDLLAKPGTSLSEIRRVVSHPQALGQCAPYLSSHGFLTEEYPNTALAAKYVAECDDPTVAAIASAEAAKIFGLTVLESDIHEKATNATRFAVFSRSPHTPPEDESGVRSVFLFTVPNRAGALASAIDIIGAHGFNLRTLRSRPMKELFWQYYFYAEAEGNLASLEGRAMLEKLRGVCDRLKTVGIYKRGDENA